MNAPVSANGWIKEGDSLVKRFPILILAILLMLLFAVIAMLVPPQALYKFAHSK